MTPITLNWQGPIPVTDIDAGSVTAGYLDASGVYLWCLQKGEQYVVTYVGKADCLRDRLATHVANIRQRKSSLLRIPAPGKTFNDDDIHQVYIPGYDPKDQASDELIEQNISRRIVFVAPVSISEYHGASIQKVEGALQIHLGRYLRTRKYLYTGVSDYSLRGGVEIGCCFPDGVDVLGLMDPFVVPL